MTNGLRSRKLDPSVLQHRAPRRLQLPRLPRGRRRALALLALGFLGALAGLATAALAVGPDPGTLRYEWSIGDRYGIDANGDEIIDNHDGITNLADDKAFIQSPTYDLTFDTCASPAVTERDELIKTYKVTLTGPQTVTKSASSCKVTASVTKLGSYTAKVELISELGTVYDTRTETIEPKDHFVVSVGDSVASGEGNPDRLEAGLPFVPVWQNAQCHRTSLAGPAQAAMRMERQDPHSSITFVHLACSGASIEEGLIGSYAGIRPADTDPVLKPQLDVLEDLAGSRQVDALLLSIGANDAKFSNVVKACLLMTNCHTDTVPGAENGKQLFDKEIPNLDRAFPLLDVRLDKMATSQGGKPPVLKGKAFFTQYYDITKDDRGQYCTGLTQKEIDAGKLPNGQTTDGINQAEMEFAATYVQDGLNAKVKSKIDAANATGGSQWEWVDGINPKFSTHGYCAADRWVRTLVESGLYQRIQDGAFHPNAEGHLYGYADSIEGKVAPFLGLGGTKLPLEADATTLAVGDALQSWIGLLDKTGGLDAITNALPFGAREEVQTWIRDRFFGKFIPWMQDRVEGAGGTLTAISERLDDLDQDGNPGVDGLGIGVDLDVTGDIQPKLPSKQYDITLTFKGSVGLEPDLALKAADLGLTGQKADGKAEFEQTVKLHLDFTKPLSDSLRLTIPQEGLTGRIKVGLSADFGGTDGAANGPDRPPLSFSAGILGLTATGPASANVELGYRIQDPSADGRIDATEIGKPLDWVRFTCTSGGANVNLKAKAALSGIPLELGSVRLQDPNLCDGVDAPQVDISNLGEFKGLTPAELINGLAQLTQSLRSIQQSADVDLPFVKEALSGIISVNDKLVKFFVDAGLTDPANPLASITFDPAQRPDLDTIGELVPKLAEALGVPADVLNMRYDAGRLLFDVTITRPPAPIGDAGTLDVGDQLDRVGLAGVTGSAKATIEPSFALNVGFGIDLKPGLSFAQRFFVKVGAGPELSADAKVTADAQLTGTLALLDVTLADTNPAGPITLLDRKDPTKPLVSVELDGKGDDKLTLEELTAPAAGAAAPVKLALNGKVPAFGLSATASVAGAPLAGGTVNISWPDITKTTGAEALSVTVDDTFTKTLLPFSFDPENPRAAIGQFLTAAQRGVAGLRSVLAKDPELVAGLPLVGKSAADLDPVLAKLDAQLAKLVELNESLTLQQAEAELEKVIGQALGVANDKLAGLVTVRYEPQTATANAALVADLVLGLCTDDRTSTVPPEPAGSPGCSHAVGKVDLPFNLQLGQTADSPGLVGLGTGGSATVSFDAGLKLGVGVELPKVAAATAPGGTPTATGTAQLFVLDTSSFELGLGARVAATLDATVGPAEVHLGTDAQPATAALAARYRLASPTANPDAPVRKRAGSELTAWLATIDPDPTTDGGLHDTVHPSGCAGGADACATLPVFVGNAPLGPITFSAPDLLAPAGWTVNADAVLNSLSTEAFQFSVLLEGIRSFSLRLENSLRSLPQGTRIPLLGTNPTAGAEVLADFRTSVVEPFQELVATLQTRGNAKAVRDEIQGFLFPRIGPDSSVNLLKDTNGNGSVTKDDIVVDLTCKIDGVVKACADTDSILKLEDIQLKAKLAKEAGGTTAPFDSGFPGLRVSSKTGISASIGFELDLAIGMDRRNGFYVRTNAFGATPELRVAAKASLPDQIDGQIAFIPVAIKDLRPGSPDVKASFGLDLSLGGDDGKMGLGQIGQAQLTPKFEACANVQLGLVTGGQAGGSGRLPSFLADLKLTGGINCAGDGETGAGSATSFKVAFDNVRVDVGTLVQDFIGPAVKNIRKYTGPLEPTIDALREPIPGIAEAARAVGQPEPTWWDLLNVINDVGMAAGQGDQLKMIKTVIFVSDLVRSLDAGTGGTGFIPLGDFDLNVAKASEPISGDRVGELLTNISETPGGSLLNRLSDYGVKPEIKTKLQDKAQSGITFPAIERPSRLFELLLGKDVPLVRFEAAGNFLHVPIGPFAFPVGPATVYFGGSLDLSGHFAAGFDTYGIRKAYALLSDDDPTNDGIGAVSANLLGGFYFDDYDASGKDVPELRAEAEVVVGAGVGIPGFGVFAEGGIGAEASIDLKTEDGKLRPEQLIAQLKKNPNPVCIFDAQAHIGAFVRLVVSTPLTDIEFPIADVTILDEPDLTAFCNTQQDDSQQKLTGTLYADGVLEVFASPESDRIYVTQRDQAGVVDVSSKGVVERFEGVTKVFVDGAAGDDTITVSADVVVDVPRPPLPAVLCGGQGKDRLGTDAGPGALHGDDGPGVQTAVNGVPKLIPCTAGPGAADTLSGSPEGDELHGGDGNDTLLGAGGDDTLKGGAKDDVLQPGAGDDEVDGAEGRDTISSADRSEATIAGVTTNLRTKKSGGTGTSEHDDLISVETAVGSSGTDELLASDAATVLDGGFGTDTLTGGKGADVLIGGSGSDVLLGGEGLDTLVGLDGDDRIVGNAGPDIHQGGAGNDVSDWTEEPGPVLVTLNGQADDGALAGEAAQGIKDNVDTEIVWGTPLNDELRAGAVPAVLEGRDGNDDIVGPGRLFGQNGDDRLEGGPAMDKDVLDGGAGNDDLAGRDGSDDLIGGGDDDRLDGGFRNDRLSGGAGFDTVDYSMRPGGVTVDMNSGQYDREGPYFGSIELSPDCAKGNADLGQNPGFTQCDEVKSDNERLLGGQGDDQVSGTTGPQVFIMGTGDDNVDGVGGDDRFEGGPGNDDLRDADFYQSSIGPDVYVGGEGDDYLGGTGGETVDAGPGKDRVALDGAFDDTVTAGPGDDTVHTAGGDDNVELGDGANWWEGGSGNKVINGGMGDDVLIRRGSVTGTTSAQLYEGDDEFDGSIGNDTVDGGPGDDFLIGSGGDDTLTDLSGANTFYAGPGNDTLHSGFGVDDIRGGDGDDDITDDGSDGRPHVGGGPAQNLWGENGNDVIRWVGGGVPGDLSGNAGNDQLFDGPGSNDLLGGSGVDTLHGGEGNDRLDGGADDDTLLGQGGDDRMGGGTGTNLLDGGIGADNYSDEGGGVDTVTYEGRSEPLTITQGVTDNNDGGPTDQSATVPGKRDEVGFAIERIIAGSGDDVISLGSLGTGEVAVTEGRGGRDVITATGLTSASYVTSLLGGDGDDTLVGSTGNDTLQGGNGNDLLRGGPGNDAVQGEAGDDRLDEGTATSGADRLSGGANTDAVDYSGRTAAVTVTIGNGVADDGEAGETDEVLDAESARIGAGAAPAKPTVTLTAAKASSVSGELVSWTAQVNQPAGQPAATGSIVLSDGNVTRSFPLDATGRAVMPYALNLVGNRTVTAAYSGDARYAANTSAGVAHAVAKVGTSTVLSLVKTPVATGTQVEVLAHVTPTVGVADPDGGVQVRENGVSLGSISLTEGRGSVKLTLPAGAHDLVGVHAGDSATLASTSAPVTVLVVDGGVAPAPAVAISTVPATPLAGESLTLKASVATGAGVPLPVGAQVTFTVPAAAAGDPAVVLGTAAVQADGTATLVLPGGLQGRSYDVTAKLAGSAWTAPGESTSTVVVGRTATTTALVSAANPAPVGSGISLTATVTRAAGAGAPTGTVTFLDGERVMGSATLSGGTATKLVTLTAGSHTVTARYSGSEVLAPSTSGPLTQVVGDDTPPPPAATATALVREGDLLAATVTGPAPAISGEVRFVVDGTPAATVAVGAGGRATMPVAGMTPGTHSVVAQYLGTATHAASTSTALSVTIPAPPAATATALVREGDVLAATVTGPEPAITGEVRFVVDGTPAATVAVGAGGRATMPVAGMAPGTRSVVAQYLGSATHAPSSSAALSVTIPPPPPAGSRFTAVTPARILDTRFGTGAPVGPVAAKGVVELQVTGRGGVPADATAVVLNVTSVAMSGSPSSFLTAWPTGSPRPNASNLNYVAGQVIPNLVTVKVGTGGKVSLYNDTGSVHVLADVAGYYATGAESAFNALQPVRLLDTRLGIGAPATPVGPNGVLELQVTGRGGVPAEATAVVLNVTAVGLSGTPSSFVTAWPTGTPLPNASNLNLVAGQIVPNLVVAKVGTGGKVSLRNDTGSVHLLADVAGYYGATGSTFTPVSPERLLDTRFGTGAPAARIPAGGTVELQVTGRGNVADNATGVVLNVTAAGLLGSPTSWITAWPTGQPMPQTSNLNMVTGEVIPNAVVAKVGANGKVSISNAAGTVDVIADVAGYFSG